jgi:cytochrome b561
MSGEHTRKYSGLAMALHWLVALAVIVSWLITQWADTAATREARLEIMGNHFALGVLIWLAVLLRFVHRLRTPPPPSNPAYSEGERALAKLAHLLIYALLLTMPLVGWFAMSKYGSSISVFGMVEIPPLPLEPDPETAAAVFERHALAGKVLLVAIALHILASLKHTIIDGDGNIFRMLPFDKSG